MHRASHRHASTAMVQVRTDAMPAVLVGTTSDGDAIGWGSCETEVMAWHCTGAPRTLTRKDHASSVVGMMHARGKEGPSDGSAAPAVVPAVASASYAGSAADDGDDVIEARVLASRRLPVTCGLGVDAMLFERTDSTNSVAERLLGSVGPEPVGSESAGSGPAGSIPSAAGGVSTIRPRFPDLVIVADSQSRGHGRLGRRWVEHPGKSLMASFVGSMPWSVVSDASVNGWIPLAAGLAALDATADVVRDCGARPTHKPCDMAVKWPNDIFCDGLKLGGILVQIVSPGDPVCAVVVGVGMNLAIPESDLSVEGSTSLLAHRSPLPDDDKLRDMMVAALTRRLRARMAEFLDSPVEAAARARRDMGDRCWTLGRRVRARIVGGGSIVGVAVGVEDDASLRIRDDAGVLHVVSTGDVGIIAG